MNTKDTYSMGKYLSFKTFPSILAQFVWKWHQKTVMKIFVNTGFFMFFITFGYSINMAAPPYENRIKSDFE